jgi:hypothetical protein
MRHINGTFGYFLVQLPLIAVPAKLIDSGLRYGPPFVFGQAVAQASDGLGASPRSFTIL